MFSRPTFRTFCALVCGQISHQLAGEMADLLATRLSGRRLDLAGDAACATEAWRGLPASINPRLPASITLTCRLRANAALYAPAPPCSGKRGRPRKWGARLGTLARIATGPATEWVEHRVRRYGKTETLMLAAIDFLWEPLVADTPMRVILVQGFTHQAVRLPAGADHRRPDRHRDRWPIEVCFEDGEELLGVGDAHNRTKKAVQPHRPVSVPRDEHHDHLVRALRASRPTPPPRPWYLTKTTPSFADMLAKLRRTVIAAQFHPGQARTPTPGKSGTSNRHGPPPVYNRESGVLRCAQRYCMMRAMQEMGAALPLGTEAG